MLVHMVDAMEAAIAKMGRGQSAADTCVTLQGVIDKLAIHIAVTRRAHNPAVDTRVAERREEKSG